MAANEDSLDGAAEGTVTATDSGGLSAAQTFHAVVEPVPRSLLRRAWLLWWVSERDAEETAEE